MEETRLLFEAVASSAYDSHTLTTRLAYVDAIVVGANDDDRLDDLLCWLPLAAATRPRVCLVAGVHPVRRAQLLHAGFDDVIDILRTSAEEGIARLVAIYRRYRHALHGDACPRALEARLHSLVACTHLSAQQHRLLRCLVENEGTVVPFDVLRQVMAAKKRSASARHLFVVIHRLRRLLRPPATIYSHAGMGYALHADPP